MWLISLLKNNMLRYMAFFHVPTLLQDKKVEKKRQIFLYREHGIHFWNILHYRKQHSEWQNEIFTINHNHDPCHRQWMWHIKHDARVSKSNSNGAHTVKHNLNGWSQVIEGTEKISRSDCILHSTHILMTGDKASFKRQYNMKRFFFVISFPVRDYFMTR